jgi:cytochrome c oxidase cbb3-type subunit 3
MAEDDNRPASAGGHIDEATGVETVGHEWDGIEELNNPLPRWWVLTFYVTILWAIGYVIAYPAIPLIEKGTEGVLGWTSRGQLAESLELQQLARAATVAALADMPVDELQAHPELMDAAVAGGAAAFRVNCVQCHGSGAAGIGGLYPNLGDDDWLWGGDLKAIETTLVHGIRQPDDPQTRFSQMPAFGRDGILNRAQIGTLAEQVLSFSGKGKASAEGAALFAANCAVCHGPDGTGLREFGAPNLADAIWLYGGSREQVAQTIATPRNGVMPGWGERLDPVTIKMLSAYVHSLGGGEDFTREVADSPAEAGDEQP